MLINPISGQTNFQAVNQKYYQWAVKDFKRGIGVSSEVLRRLRYDVDWGHIHPQDGIDTIEAIKKMIGGSGDFIEHVLNNFKDLIKN